MRAWMTWAAVSALAGLLGCGGGGADHDAAAVPQAGEPPVAASAAPATSATPQERQASGGSWIGTAGARVVFGFMLKQTGAYYLLYSPPNEPTQLAGFLQGTGTLVDGRFVSEDGRDYPFAEQTSTVTLSGTADDEQNFIGTVGPPTAPQELLLRYMAYYEPLPTLQAVAGTYAVQASFGAAGTFTIGADGELKGGGDSSACALTGRLSPRSDDHVLDIALSFAGPLCAFPGQSFTGVAFRHPALATRLYITAFDAARATGIVFVADR